MSAVRRKVRKLRHWKQRFDKNASFIWRKPVIWKGETVEVGSDIPKDLTENGAKLRRFWEAQVIELAEFEEPDVATGKPEPKKKDPTPEPEVLTGLNPEAQPYDIKGELVPADEVVELAFEEFGGTIAEWNALSDEDRETRLENVIRQMTDEGDEPATDPLAEEPKTEEPAKAKEEFSSDDPAEYIIKFSDRKWGVKGTETLYQRKGDALDAAKAIVAARNSAENTETSDAAPEASGTVDPLE